MPFHRRLATSSDSSCVLRSERRDRQTYHKGENLTKLQLAGDAVAKGVTVRRAAEMYGIPTSTLHGHANGKVLLGASAGFPKYLSDAEEQDVVRWLEGCAKVGCAKTVHEVRAVVGSIVAKNQRESLAYRQAVATNPDTFRKYFDLLEDVLASNNLLHCSS